MKNMRLNSIMAGGVLLLGMYGCTPKVQDYSSYVESVSSVREDMNIPIPGL